MRAGVDFVVGGATAEPIVLQLPDVKAADFKLIARRLDTHLETLIAHIQIDATGKAEIQ